MSVALRCPVCHDRLGITPDRRSYRCPANHSFDIAADGHVNLLLSHQRKSREPGDSKDMVRSRRDFLDAGYYQPTADALAAAVADALPPGGTCVLDTGCGEGFFTRTIAAAVLDAGPSIAIAGLDVSKPAIVAAAKRDKRSLYLVASSFDLPVLDASVDVVISNFAPVDGPEFSRVLRPHGSVVTVHPAPNHLFALRQLVYDRPEPHAPKEPLRHHPELFDRVDSRRVTAPIELPTATDATNLLAMTPYWWQADEAKQAHIATVPGLNTELDVLITTYRLRP